MTEQINNAAISMVQAAALQMDPTRTAAKDNGEKNDFQKLLEEKSKPTTPERKEQAEAEEKETVEPVKKKKLPLREERLISVKELLQSGQISVPPGVIPVPQPVVPKMEIMGAGDQPQMLSVESIEEGKLITDEFAQDSSVQVVQGPMQEPVQQEIQPQEEVQSQEEAQPQQAVEAAQPSQAEQTEAPVEQAAPVHAEKVEAHDSEEPEVDASFEPTLDYVVVKIPRLPFDKFIKASRSLTTQMKATGEVMSICTSFEGALMKALRSLEQHIDSLLYGLDKVSTEEIRDDLHRVDDRRIFVIAEALRRGITEEEIHDITKVDIWFIDKISNIVKAEKRMITEPMTKELMKEVKRLEFPDSVIGKLCGKEESEIKAMRDAFGIHAAFKIVDTCAAEFEASTPYYYSCFDGENEVELDHTKKKVMVLGSGPIRIGQGIEFDYCSVHSTWALKKAGYETIIVNNNPETVSTDFDIADRLYFEPLTPEDVEAIVDLEKPDGAVVQFGGQTAIKLTEALLRMGVKILGTSAENVDAAEDRELFDEILEQCCIPRPAGHTVFTQEEAIKAANALGYPVLVRPSYVLGGQGMQIAINDQDIIEFMEIINRTVQEHPILVDKYLMGKEVEVDAVCDGEDILIPGIMEHVERAGIHSGDSISVYPAMSLSPKIKRVIEDYTRKLANSLHVIGLINIQFIVYQEEVYVIEVNPRSSRTVPYISKVTGIPIVDLASRVIIGEKIKDLGFQPGLQPESQYFAIKMPVFSFEKLRGAEISLGPEMKSTGECLGISKDFHEALYKAFLGAGIDLPKHKKMILTVKDSDKLDAVDIGQRFQALGYEIYSTRSTCRVLNENGVKAKSINKVECESPNLLDLILGHEIDLVIDTPAQGIEKSKDGFIIRRHAIETGVTVLTSLDTADALLTSLESANPKDLSLVDIAGIDRAGDGA